MSVSSPLAAAGREPRIVSTTRDRVGECPVWDGAAQALYWEDIEGRRIHRLDWATGTQRSWSTPERVGCFALDAQGGIVAAMESGVYKARLPETGEPRFELVAPIRHAQPEMRFNDGRCDAQGRFWISTMCMNMALAARVGGWFCLDERGLTGPYLENFITPNGMAFSPDGRTVYLSDSHPSVQKIWAFDYDGATGRIGEGREFIDMTPLPGRPDGAAMDAEGHYWICGNDAGQVHRFDPQGQLVASFDVPVAKPSMCCFGGPQLDTLFVTSIQPAGVEAGLSGAVFALSPGVRGLPEPRFTRWPA